MADSIGELVAIFAPDHVAHGRHEWWADDRGDVQAKCPCSARLTFLATEIAKLDKPGPAGDSARWEAAKAVTKKGARDGA